MSIRLFEYLATLKVVIVYFIISKKNNHDQSFQKDYYIIRNYIRSNTRKYSDALISSIFESYLKVEVF